MARMRVLVAAVGVSLIAAGSAVAAGPSVRLNRATEKAVRASLLTSKYFPPSDGWSAAPPSDPQGFSLECPGWMPDETGIVETAAASSPTFAGVSGGEKLGPFVEQATDAYATAAQAASLWRRAIAHPGLLACVVDSLDEVEQKGLRVTVVLEGGLPVERVSAMTIGFRVVAILSPRKASASASSREKTYFDVILVGRGRSISELTISSIGSTVPTKVENALALIVYSRLGALGAGG